MLTILMGKTCSGKDAIAKELINRGWHRIITYTTRKRRKREKDGVDYHFITPEDFMCKVEDGFFLEHQKYTIADGSIVRYGSPKEEMLSGEDNQFIILTPDGYKRFLKASPETEHAAIYIYANNKTIKKRLKKRGDSLDEAERRIKADDRDFKNCESLDQIDIPSGVKTIGKRAFFKTNIDKNTLNGI